MTHDFSRTPLVFKAEKTPQMGTENDPFFPLLTPGLTHNLTHGSRFAAWPSSCTIYKRKRLLDQHSKMQ
jgi:hypothetical protein